MTSVRPQVVTGWIVPGVIEPQFQFSHLTDKPYGRALEKEIFTPAPPVQPKSLGDERHGELLSAIKGLSVKQNVAQTTEALPQNRDWR